MLHKTHTGSGSKISSSSSVVTGVCLIPECTFSTIENKPLNFN